jgi:beta-barrel assembly-enhancing protease
MQRSYRYGIAVLLIFMTNACVTAPVKPLTVSEHAFGQTEDEKKLIQLAAKADEELRSRGVVLQDERINAYIRAVAGRLIPPGVADAVPFHFYVARDPIVNAFALPNGSIYLYVGLLARLENEAQLAHVLSHEIAHVVQRHSLLSSRNRRATIIAANVADLLLFGTSIAYIPAIGSLAGHSRESEAEADRLALEYMSRAGYPLEGAEQTFKLIQEVKQKESAWGSVYSSHPDNEQRAQATREIIGRLGLSTNAGNPNGAEKYLAIRGALMLENVRLKLNVRQYQLAAESAERAFAQDPKSPWWHYYRGEAYLRMAEDPAGAARENAWINDKTYDDDLVAEYRNRKQTLLASARQAYQASLGVDKNFAHAYRGLGLVAYAEGESKAARESLTYYLTHAKDITDRPYINIILGRLDSK